MNPLFNNEERNIIVNVFDMKNSIGGLDTNSQNPVNSLLETVEEQQKGENQENNEKNDGKDENSENNPGLR